MGLLGYGSLTLTDLTDALPASLNLSSSLNSNIQVKEGTVYAPDFTKGGVIITPSLFLGGDEVPSSKYVGKIVYTVNGEDYVPNAEDKNGVLVCYKIEKNLEANCSIGARIENFVSDENIKYTSIYSLNPVNLILLEKNAGYSAFIESAREHFEEGDTEPTITLTARLYSGINELSKGVSYQWTDSDGTDWGTDKSIKVNRDQIGSMETFICEMTNSYGTKFRVSKNLYDRTDAYQSAIISNGSTILTPQHTSITLTNQIWYKTSIVNGASAQANDFTYNWYCLSENGNFSDKDHGKERTFSIDLNHAHEDGTLIFPKENFVVYCETTIRKKVVVVSSLAIQYSPVNYSVSISPVAVFIPTSSNGSYRGSAPFTKEITFQLLDDNKKPLPFNTSDKAPSISDSEPFTSVGISSRGESTWDFTITLTYEPSTDTSNKFKNMDSSKDFSISYKYLGVPFEANFQCIKSIQGEDGEIGASGYTVSLSNEFWMLAGGEVSATPNQTTETDILVMEGAENLDIIKLKIGESEFDSTGKLTVNNILIEKEGSVNKKLKFTSKQGLTTSGSLPIYITFKSLEDKEITMVKTFRYEINYKGDAYSLLCEPSSLVYTPSSRAFNSSSVVLSPVCYVGGVGDATAMDNNKYTITAQIDNGTETVLSSLTYTTFDKTNQSITFRLYREKSTAPAREKLVDICTIPIIISQEGLVVGGENLIPWTKKMPFENNKWKEVGSVARGESYGFATLDFSATGKEATVSNNHCETPKFPVQDVFVGKQMTFSAEVYSANWKSALSHYSAGVQEFYFFLHVVKGTTDLRYKMGAIHSNSFIDGLESNDAHVPIDGKWFTVYSTFTYPSDFEALTDGELYITAGSQPYGEIKIKKLKLELGNIPTAWSARDGDTTLADVAGTNLSQLPGFQIQIHGNESKDLTTDLDSGNTYTFSVARTEISNGESGVSQFLCEVIRAEGDTSQVVQTVLLKNNSDQLQTYTFALPSDQANYTFRMYARNISTTSESLSSLTLILTYVKIEEGSEATSYFITDDYLKQLLSSLQEGDERFIKIIGADGNVIMSKVGADIEAAVAEINNTLQGSYITKSDKNDLVEMINKKLSTEDDYLKQLRASITFSTKDVSDPYIQIASDSDAQHFATRIGNNQIGFYQDASRKEPIAYFSGNELVVNNATFYNQFKIGELVVSITSAGVGFGW